MRSNFVCRMQAAHACDVIEHRLNYAPFSIQATFVRSVPLTRAKTRLQNVELRRYGSVVWTMVYLRLEILM